MAMSYSCDRLLQLIKHALNLFWICLFSAVYVCGQEIFFCDPLPPFPNGRIIYRDLGGTIIDGPYPTDTTAEYVCLSGYTLVGGATKRCIAEDNGGGEWILDDGTEPSCVG